MHIQVSEATYAALTASQLGYIMKQRGEVKIKVIKSDNFYSLSSAQQSFGVTNITIAFAAFTVATWLSMCLSR